MTRYDPQLLYGKVHEHVRFELWLTRSLVLILELAERDWHGVRHDDRQEGQAAEEPPMNDASFLSQLEQRTQQVKITLAKPVSVHCTAPPTRWQSLK